MMQQFLRPRLRTVLIILIVILSVNGVFAGSSSFPPDTNSIAEKAAFIAGGFFASFTRAVLIAAAIWAAATFAKRFRLRGPDPAANLIGKLLFWAALIGATYCLLVAAYVLTYAALAPIENFKGIALGTMTAAIAVLLWALGAGIRDFLIPYTALDIKPEQSESGK